MAVTEATKRIIWVQAGGRCTLCKQEVLDTTISPKCVADVAHAAGQGDGPATPRPVPEMSAEERDDPANLLLLCLACHRKVDDKAIEVAYDLDTLYELKREHEHTVRYLLSLMEGSQTLVLRMIGDVRGNTVSASRLEIAAATAARGRVPAYLDERHHDEFEIDLRGVSEDDPHYWDVQRRRVEKEVMLARDAIARGVADHMTVFAFARLPLLVLLGWLLDDTTRIEIAQRSRGSEGWKPVSGEAIAFDSQVRPSEVNPHEALLHLPLSGSPDLEALPDDLADLARASVMPVGAHPDVSVADDASTREAFDRELRRALGGLEQHTIKPTTLHLVAAAPISLAIAAGRAIDPQVFPTVHVYDLGADHRYRCVLTLDSKDQP